MSERDNDEVLGEALSSRRPEPNRDYASTLRDKLLEARARANRPQHLWLLVGAYVLTGVVLLIIAASASAAPGSFTRGFSDVGYEIPSVSNLYYDRTVAVGGRMVLLSASWASIAPRRPSGDASDPRNPAYTAWSGLDDAVRNGSARGLTMAMAVAPSGGGPAWADGRGRPKRVPPGTWRPSASAFRSFATAVARRYSGSFDPGDGKGRLPHVRYYQGWSEPNLPDHLNPQWVRSHGRWIPASASTYRNLINAFYAGVKSVHRSNLVITGGTAPFGDVPGGPRVPPATFVKSLLCVSDQLKPLRCPTKAHFDILAHHPYAVGGPFKHALNSYDVSVPDLGRLTQPLAVAIRHNLVVPRTHKRLWITEFSWDSNPPDPQAVPMNTYERWVEESFYELWHQGVDTLAWYNVVDQAPIPDYRSTYQSGMYFLNGQPKPAARAFAFPFVVERSGGGHVLWGLAPRTGSIVIQQSVKGGWRTMMTLHARAGHIFKHPINLHGGRPLLRAVEGPLGSLTFRPT